MVNSNLNLFYDCTRHNKTNISLYNILSWLILRYNILIRYLENIYLNYVYSTSTILFWT